MNAAILTAVLLFHPSPQATEQKYVSTPHGLELQYPSNWKFEKKKNFVAWTIPTAAGPARVELFATNYRKDAESWQKIQAQVNTDMKREVVRQWEEVLLGVPLLLTQVQYDNKTLLIGILYSASRDKFHFRLESPSSGFDEAESAWKSTLNTLRPIGGAMPSVEDGQKPVDPTPTKEPTTVTFSSSSAKPAKPSKGEMKASVANRDVTLFFPENWTLTAKDGFYELKNPDLSGTARIELYSTIDSPEGGVTAMKWMNQDLDHFDKVLSRENLGPKLNSVGANMFYGTRIGQKDGKPRNVIAGVADYQGYYFFLVYESSDEAATFTKKRKLIESFFDKTRLQAAP